eukprot:11630-Heterococcus_DN1.PRE.2
MYLVTHNAVALPYQKLVPYLLALSKVALMRCLVQLSVCRHAAYCSLLSWRSSCLRHPYVFFCGASQCTGKVLSLQAPVALRQQLTTELTTAFKLTVPPL